MPVKISNSIENANEKAITIQENITTAPRKRNGAKSNSVSVKPLLSIK